VLGQGDQPEPGIAQEAGDLDPAQASIDERSGSSSGCDTQSVLEVLDRHPEVVGQVGQ